MKHDDAVRGASNQMRNNAKRLRSPGRRFIASPSNRRAKRGQFNFADPVAEKEEIDLLSRNLFDVPSTPKKKSSVIVSDRHIPSRTSNFSDALLVMNENRSLHNTKENAIIGVSGLDHTSPATQTSQNSTNSSAANRRETFESFVRDELIGQFTQNTPASHTARVPQTPNKKQQTRLFRYQVSQKTRLEFNSVVSTHTLSPLTSFKSIDRYRDLYSSTHRGKRKINKYPFKILDAPALKDDYYLNLVDWSSQNVLAVALSSSVYLWNATTTKVELLTDVDPNTSTEDDNKNLVTSVTWSPDGALLAFGTKRGKIQVWDIQKKVLIRTMVGHTARVGSLAWSRTLLASGSRDKSIHRRDIRTPQDSIAKLSGHKQEVCGLRWAFDGKQLASGGNDNKLLIWDCHKEKPLWRFSNYHQAAVKAVAWSPHENGLLASGGGTADRCIKFWNTLTGTNLNSLDTGSQVCNLMWSKSVNEIVSTHGYSLNHMIVWKYPSMSKVATLNGHTLRVLYLAMSPNGQTVVTGAGDERLCFWNLFPGVKTKERSGFSSMLSSSFNIR